jgi:hypothetical protein
MEIKVIKSIKGCTRSDKTNKNEDIRKEINRYLVNGRTDNYGQKWLTE